MPTYVSHFSSGTDVSEAFEKLNAPLNAQGYVAYICGNEWNKEPSDNEQRLHTLTNAVGWLRDHGYSIEGYVPGVAMYVDDQGNVYWGTPDGTRTSDYERDLSPPGPSSKQRPVPDWPMNEWQGQFID